MKIYTPVYDRGWKIEELEKEDLRRLGGTHMLTRWKKNVGHYGNIYHDDAFFKTRQAALDWIAKRPVRKDTYVTFE